MAKKLNNANLLTVISVVILVGTEIIAASLAFGWAIGGLLELSETLRMVVVGACFLFGAYAVFMFFRMANRIEPVYTE